MFLVIIILFLISICVIIYTITRKKTVLVLGDSMSSGFGFPVEKGWVNILSENFPNLKIINGSISGETLKGALEKPVKKGFDIVLIELGANDAIEGKNLSETDISKIESDLTELVNRYKATGAEVALLGMKFPPEFVKGDVDYSTKFGNMYKSVSEKTKTRLVPFILEGLKFPASFQKDQKHPNVDSQILIERNVAVLF